MYSVRNAVSYFLCAERYIYQLQNICSGLLSNCKEGCRASSSLQGNGSHFPEHCSIQAADACRLPRLVRSDCMPSLNSSNNCRNSMPKNYNQSDRCVPRDATGHTMAHHRNIELHRGKVRVQGA